MRRAARQRPARRARPPRDPGRSRSTCSPSRSSPRSPRRIGARTTLYELPAPRLALSRSWRAPISTRSSQMLADGFTTRRGRRGALIHRDAVNHMLRGRRGARHDGADLRRHDPRHRRLSGGAGAREPRHRHASTRISPSRAWPATCSSSATRPIAFSASSAGRCGWRMRRASRRPSRSGWAKRPAAPTSCRLSVSRLRAEIAARLAIRSVRRGRAALAGRGDWHRHARCRPTRRISGCGARGARLPADAGHHCAGALLRRSGRHAARHPRAVRQPDQPRVGPGAAQALLPQIQLRAAGGGHRGQYRAVADHGAQFRARPKWRAISIRTASGRC